MQKKRKKFKKGLDKCIELCYIVVTFIEKPLIRYKTFSDAVIGETGIEFDTGRIGKHVKILSIFLNSSNLSLTRNTVYYCLFTKGDRTEMLDYIS